MSEIDAILNRMSIFSGEPLLKAARELEDLAQNQDYYKTVSSSSLSYLMEFFVPAYPDAVIRCVSLALANACTTDDLSNCRHLLKNDVAAKCKALLHEKRSSAVCVFAVLDVIATLCTSSGDSRNQFRCCIMEMLDAVRSHKTDFEVLFATVCALSTMTLADALTSLAVAKSGGVQVLVEIFKFSSRHRKQSMTEADKMKLVTDVWRWSRQALLNIAKCPTHEIDQIFDSAPWGTFGDLVEADELKMDITLSRRKMNQRIGAHAGDQKK